MRIRVLLLFLITAILVGCKPTQETTENELQRLQGIVDTAVMHIEQCDDKVRKECLGIVKSEKYNKEVLSILKNKDLVQKCFEDRQKKCRNNEFLIAQMPKAKDVFALSLTRSIEWTYPWGKCIFGGVNPTLFIEYDKISCTSTKEHITYAREISTLATFPSPHYTYPTRNCMAMGDKELALAVCKLVTQDKSPKVQKVPNSSENAFVYTYQKE